MTSSTSESILLFLQDSSHIAPKGIAEFIDNRSAFPISLRRLLESSTSSDRAIGLSRVINELCSGIDTAWGAELGTTTLNTLLDANSDLGIPPNHLLMLWSGLASGTAYSLFNEGRFAECESFPESLGKQNSQIRSAAGYMAL